MIFVRAAVVRSIKTAVVRINNEFVVGFMYSKVEALSFNFTGVIKRGCEVSVD